MSDQKNSRDRRRWAGISVLAAWVYFNDSTQMGFALSDRWTPGEVRKASGKNARADVAHMGLPTEIVEWLRNLFHEGSLTSVAIQGAERRWRIHMSFTHLALSDDRLLLRENPHDDAEGVVDRLIAAANLPHGSHGNRIAAIEEIRRGSPHLSEEDALAFWLGGRIHTAVQQIFAFSKR